MYYDKDKVIITCGSYLRCKCVQTHKQPRQPYCFDITIRPPATITSSEERLKALQFSVFSLHLEPTASNVRLDEIKCIAASLRAQQKHMYVSCFEILV